MILTMNSIESVSSGAHVDESVDSAVREILDGPPINDYVKRQIQLAVERFGLEHPSDTLDRKTLNDVFMAWADLKSPTHYSDTWSEFVKHPDFKKESGRFNGDYSKVTLKDLETFKAGGCKELPE